MKKILLQLSLFLKCFEVRASSDALDRLLDDNLDNPIEQRHCAALQ